MSLSCTVFEISSLISQNLKRSHDPQHISFGGSLPALVLLSVNQHTKYGERTVEHVLLCCCEHDETRSVMLDCLYDILKYS